MLHIVKDATEQPVLTSRAAGAAAPGDVVGSGEAPTDTPAPAATAAAAVGGGDAVTTLRTLIDLLPIGVMIARDQACESVDINDAAARILGLGERGVGLRAATFIALRDGRPVPPEELPMRRALATGKPVGDVAVDVRRPDGSIGHLLKRAAPLRDAGGRIVGCVAVIVDQTDRVLADARLQESQMRYRRLYESSQVGIAFYSEDGRLEEPNDALLAMLHMTRQTYEREGLNWRNLTAPGWEEADARGLEELRGSGRCSPFEKQLRRLDGSLVPVLISAANLHPGRSDHGVAVFVDLSRQKAAENALRTLNESLERRIAERASESDARAEQLRDLALALADAEARERKRLAQLLHDHFQQLLSAAKLKAGLVRRSVGDSPAKGSLEQIERLLDAAIAESRSLISDLSPPVLYDAGLCAALEALARATEKKHGIDVEFECDTDAEPESEQIRVLLFEAVRELLHNVVSHAAARRVVVRVQRAAGRTLHVVVTDDGRGFDVAVLRGRKAAAEGGPADGPSAAASRSFGLMEVRERLKYIGGDLTLRSRPGQGTQAEIRLSTTLRRDSAPERPCGLPDDGEGAPVSGGGNGDDARGNGRPAAGEAAIGTHAPADARRGDRNGARPVRLVVADDHAIFREGLISLIHQDATIQVVGEAADGEEAVELVRRLRPDVLVVDVSMPKLNGLQVTRLLSAELPDLKIVGLSMHEREDMARAMRAAGATAYLTKGGASDNLLNVLRQLVPDPDR